MLVLFAQGVVGRDVQGFGVGGSEDRTVQLSRHHDDFSKFSNSFTRGIEIRWACLPGGQTKETRRKFGLNGKQSWQAEQDTGDHCRRCDGTVMRTPHALNMLQVWRERICCGRLVGIKRAARLVSAHEVEVEYVKSTYLGGPATQPSTTQRDAGVCRW